MVVATIDTAIYDSSSPSDAYILSQVSPSTDSGVKECDAVDVEPKAVSNASPDFEDVGSSQILSEEYAVDNVEPEANSIASSDLEEFASSQILSESETGAVGDKEEYPLDRESVKVAKPEEVDAVNQETSVNEEAAKEMEEVESSRDSTFEAARKMDAEAIREEILGSESALEGQVDQGACKGSLSAS